MFSSLQIERSEKMHNKLKNIEYQTIIHITNVRNWTLNHCIRKAAIPSNFSSGFSSIFFPVKPCSNSSSSSSVNCGNRSANNSRRAKPDFRTRLLHELWLWVKYGQRHLIAVLWRISKWWEFQVTICIFKHNNYWEFSSPLFTRALV